MLSAGAPNTRHEGALVHARGVEGVGAHVGASPVSHLVVGVTGTLEIMVPMPESVKISSSSTWAMRPSRMWALRTPLRTAWMQLPTLGIIPPAIVPSSIERVELVGGGLADQARRVVDPAAQPLDVGEVDELLGAERLGDRAGDGVGVDVVRLTVRVGADGGDDGDELVVEQPVEHARVDRLDVADEAELGVAGRGADQPGVLAADADRVGAVDVDRARRSAG